MRVVPTFNTLNYTELPPNDPVTVDITKKELESKRFIYGPNPRGIRMQLLKSRVKPNLSVSVYLTSSQLARSPLLISDVQYVDEIYNTVLTLQVSHNGTMNTLFSKPFNVTLIKKNAMSDWGRSASTAKNNKRQEDEPGTFISDTDRVQKTKVTYTNEDHQRNKEMKKQLAKQSRIEERKREGKIEGEGEGDERDSEEEDYEMGSGANFTKKLKGEKKSNTNKGGENKKGLVDLVNSVKMDAVTQEVIDNHWLPALRKMDVYRMKYGVAPFYMRTVEVEVESYTIVPKKKKKKKEEHLGKTTTTPASDELSTYSNREKEELEEGDNGDAYSSDTEGRSPRKRARHNTNTTMLDIYNHPFANRTGLYQRWDNLDDQGIDEEFSGKFLNSEVDMERAFSAKNLDGITSFRRKKKTTDSYNFVDTRDKPPAYKGVSSTKKNLDRISDRSGGYADYKDAGELFGYPLPDQNEKDHLPHPNRMAPTADRKEETTDARITNLSRQHNGRGQLANTGGGNILGETDHVESDQIVIGDTKLKDIRNRQKAETEALDASNNLTWSDDEGLERARKKLMVATDPGITGNKPNVIPGKTGSATPYDTSSILGPNGEATSSSRNNSNKEGGHDPQRKRKRSEYEGDEQNSTSKMDPLEDFDLITVKTKIKHNVPVVPEIELGSIEVYEELGTLGYIWVWNTNDEFSGKIEPYMMWVVFHAPKVNGKLTSPVSGMIGMYQDYQSAKRELDLAVEDMRNPFYTIETVESKARPDHKGQLGGENYVPVLESRQGYSRTLELNDMNLQRQPSYEERYGGLPIRPRGFLPEDGPMNRPPAWDSGRLMDRTTDSYRATMPNVIAARELNRQLGFGLSQQAATYGTRGWANPEEYFRSNNIGGAWGAGSMNGGNIGFPSNNRRPTYEVYDRMARAAEYNANVQDAALTWHTIGRPTMHTPQGKFMFLEINEKLNKIEKTKHLNENRVNSCMEKLENSGSLLGGSPNPMLMGKLSSKGAGADGVFTSKVNPKSDASSYGLSITSNVLSPNKEFCEEVQKELKNTYSNVVKEIFIIGYREVLHSQEYWYRKMVEQTFRTEIERMRRRTARTKEDESLILSDVPNFESMFSVNITFPMNSSSIGLNKALDLYGLKFWTAEQVYLEFLKEVPGNIKNEDLLQMITDTNTNSDLTYEGTLSRFTEGLEKALEYEKKKGIKEPTEGGREAKVPPSKKKVNNKAGGGAEKKKKDGAKIKPEKKATIKAKAKAKAKAKTKAKIKAKTKASGKDYTKSKTTSKTTTPDKKSNQDNNPKSTSRGEDQEKKKKQQQ